MREVVVDAAGRVAVREAVVVLVGRVVEEVADVSLPTGLLAVVEVVAREVAVEGVFRSADEPRTLDLRSAVEVVDEVFNGARVLVVPATDMRLAVLEMPRFSSPELATERFSSAELLIDARERWEEVVDVLKGLRVAVLVVVGRVGGLFKVLLVLDRAVEVVPGFETVEVGLLVVAVVETGRLDDVVELGLALAGGEVGLFFLEASGLVIYSLPESTVESTGVAGGRFSASTSEEAGASTGASAGTSVGTGSSVEDIVCNCKY